MKSVLVVALVLVHQSVNAQSRFWDTTIQVKKPGLILKMRYIDRNRIVLTASGKSFTALTDTIEGQGFINIQVPDFNSDRYADILLTYGGNNATYFLYLYDPKGKRYRQVDDFGNFPAAVQLKAAANYYYSYSRAGCADFNWISDLFTIENFKAIHKGHIDGNGCQDATAARVVACYRIVGNDASRRKLIAKLPYDRNIPEFSYKWRFIKDYWNRNYARFR